MNKTLKTLLWSGAGAAGLAAANSSVFARAKALGNTLGGEGRFWPGPYGDIFYARQGKGRPVVLLHGIYAGASGYEWRKNFDALSEHFNVYAPDWLGFGLSDKPRRRYTAETYIEQLTQFLREVVKEPCTLVASSLAAAYAVRAARNVPDAVQGLILVCPTGFRHLAQPPDARAEALYQLLNAPLVGTTVYNGIVSQAGLRWYLMNQAYFDPSYVDDAMVDHYSTAAHQYGGQYAPPAFLSGLLNHSIADALPALPQKTVRLIWGREARMTPLSDAEAFLAANARAELTVLDKSGLLPHDEQAQAFNRLVVETINADAPAPKKTRPRKTAADPTPEGE
ncbi:MAG: alpha/beta fold hydrolase [Armatimonadetes bacterium]|nr:alpha/beta fold hydrolase [Armatimonadota bacterium]